MSGPAPQGYTPPVNWTDPAVSGRDLIVHRAVLRQVASQLVALSGQLQGALSGWDGPAAQAGSATVLGGWPEAQQLAAAVGNAHAGVGQFSNDLRQSHNDTATRITLSADHYDAAERQITTLIHAAHDPSATIVQSGGNNVPVSPGYGQNWTPQQRQGYYLARRMGGGGPNWTATFPITQNSAFAPASVLYTWQQVQALLRATNPATITVAGTAYGMLSTALTDIANQLTRHGQKLAANWGGSTAVTAVSHLQQLYQTAADMQANTAQAQQSLAWYGGVLTAFKNSALSSTMQPATTHPAAVAAADAAATQLMRVLNGHVQTAYYQLPGAVNKNLPPPMAGNGGKSTAGGVGGAAGGTVPGTTAGGGAGGAGTIPGMPGGPGTVGNIPGMTGGPGGTMGIGPGSQGGTVPGVTGGQGGVPGGTVPGGTVPGGTVPGGTVPGGTVPGGSLGQLPAPTQLAGVPGGAGLGTIVPPAAGPGGAGGTPPGIVPGGSGGGIGVLPGALGIPGTRGSGGSGPGRYPNPAGALVSGGAPAPGEIAGGVPGIPGTLGPGSGLASLGEPSPIGPAGMITGQSVPGAAEGVPAGGLAASGDVAAGEMAGGPGGFPMMGGVSGTAGQGGAGRARQSWITEEEGTWGPEAASAGSPAAGEPLAGNGMAAMMPAGGGSDRQRDRSRQSWMDEEDLWGTGQPVVPPVIGRE